MKKIRGVMFSTKVSSQFENSMIRAARGIVNPLVSDVHIFTYHRTGPLTRKYDFLLLVDILDFLFGLLNVYLIEAKKIILRKAIIPFYLNSVQCIKVQKAVK